MPTKQLLKTILFSIPLLSVAGFAAPVLEERQGEGAEILLNTIISVINSKTQSPNVCDICTSFSEDVSSYNMLVTQADDGQHVAACWANNTDNVMFGQAEANAANCLTNLHYTQADTCISVAGSECDTGYTAGGGRLQNLRELIAGKGTQSGAQISGDESSALQAGINAIIGSNVRGTGANGPFFILTDKTASYREGDLSAQMEVNWIGEYGC